MSFMMMNEHYKEGCMKASRHPYTRFYTPPWMSIVQPYALKTAS